ncbi:hypothetical protein J2T12_003595 [Paenibacillus anaericanus]|uniref:hypothetical protein n=1 Tax=Paenibacillus anaericanus TaxID=170367 RepID=UPI002789C349|nr:hypothetical protein [Paenibacillus anaericanus]MDQ0090181.1 hypothetical protein [Paenibacillus anaericanus]
MIFKKKSNPHMEQVEVGYSREQFLTSQAFSGVEKDIISVILEEGLRYSKSDVQEEINKFKNRGVK